MKAHVTSVSIQKGGTAKTTVCRNLGEEVSLRGRKVLLIDNDPQGNLTKAFFGDDLPQEILSVAPSFTGVGQKVIAGVSNSFYLYENGEMPVPLKINDNLYIIGATKNLADSAAKPQSYISSYAEKVASFRGDFDDIFIDCPPSAGLLQTAAHMASDYLLIPTLLNEDSIDGVYQQIDTMRSTKRGGADLKLLGVLVNAKSTRKLNLEDYYYDVLKSKFEEYLFEVFISHSVKVSEARSLNKSVMSYAPTSVQAEQYVSLCDEYLSRLEDK